MNCEKRSCVCTNADLYSLILSYSYFQGLLLDEGYGTNLLNDNLDSSYHSSTLKLDCLLDPPCVELRAVRVLAGGINTDRLALC